MKKRLPIVLFSLVALLLAPMSVVADTPEGPPLVPSTASVLGPVSNSAFLVGKKKKKGRAKKKFAVAVTALFAPGGGGVLPGARMSFRMLEGSFELHLGTFAIPVLSWSGPSSSIFPVQLGARKFFGTDTVSFFAGGGATTLSGFTFFQLDAGVHFNSTSGLVLGLGAQMWWHPEGGLASTPLGVFELGWSF
jgi:hypothetical protein